MQKKIYEVPNLEVYNMEPESMLADSFNAPIGGGVQDGEVEEGGGEFGEDIGTNKKQYGFNNAPWE